MTRDELHAWAIRHGFKQDSWGHYHRPAADKQSARRIKVQARSWRYERQIVYERYGGRVEKHWIRILGAYFESSHIDPVTDRLIVDKST